jgi:hypothetical protein
MFSSVFARRSIFLGISASVFGIILYSQLGRVANLRMSLWVLNLAAALSLSMTLLGLLAILVGGILWAWRAPLAQVPLAGVSVGIVAFSLVEFANIDIHESTAILMPVVMVSAVGAP